MPTMSEIQAFADEIGRAFNPDRVVLFGSHAYGTPTKDSDVDLLVIMPFEGKGHHVATRIRTDIHPPFPLDLIVRTPETIQERLDLGDDFIKEIVRKGKVLYAPANR